MARSGVTNPDHRLAEEALGRYRELFELAPIGYATLEAGDTIAEINQRGAELLGRRPAELAGSRVSVFVASQSLDAFQGVLTAAAAKAGPVRLELELARGGVFVPVRIVATALGRTTPTTLLGFEDISERKAKELEHARSEHALREEARRKDEFLAVLSHELRNSLAPIRTSVAVLEMLGLPSEEARSSVDIIARSTRHLARLVDDLLDVTRITRGKITLQLEPVDLTALVRRVLEEHSAGFAAHGIDVESRLPTTPTWVRGDPARLVQILCNLLSNAEKFTPATGRVSVVLEAAAGSVLLHVRDNGIGIAPEVIGELGVPFAQAPQALDRSHGGLGLGLAMVRMLAELHGGSIAIHSEGVGHGAEVVVSLPAHVARPVIVPASGGPAGPPRRILLIEDNPDAARSLARALTLRGHVVETALTGYQGIARASELIPEIVLCDVGLPDLDGFAVARRLREDARLRGVSIVALTGYGRPEDIVRASDAGFDRHVTKPASLPELEQVLRELPRR